MNWPYVAGFFDGEGSIRIAMGNKSTSVQIGIHQAGKRGFAALRDMQRFLLERDIPSGIQKQRDIPNTNKPMYRLYVYNIENAKRFVGGVMPYLHIKKLECQDIVRFVRMYPPYYAWLARLNSKIGCEICGAPRKVTRSRTCGSLKCRGTLIWKVRKRVAPVSRYIRVASQENVEKFAKQCAVDPRVRSWL